MAGPGWSRWPTPSFAWRGGRATTCTSWSAPFGIQDAVTVCGAGVHVAAETIRVDCRWRAFRQKCRGKYVGIGRGSVAQLQVLAGSYGEGAAGWIYAFVFRFAKD